MLRYIAVLLRAGEGLLTFAARNTFRKEVPTEAMEDEEAMCIFVETGIIGRFSI